MSDLSERMDDASRQQDRAQAKLEAMHDAAELTTEIKLEVLRGLARGFRAIPDELWATAAKAALAMLIGAVAPERP